MKPTKFTNNATSPRDRERNKLADLRNKYNKPASAQVDGDDDDEDNTPQHMQAAHKQAHNLRGVGMLLDAERVLQKAAREHKHKEKEEAKQKKEKNLFKLDKAAFGDRMVHPAVKQDLDNVNDKKKKDVLDGTGNYIAKTTASAATPITPVPNPNMPRMTVAADSLSSGHYGPGLDRSLETEEERQKRMEEIDKQLKKSREVLFYAAPKNLTAPHGPNRFGTDVSNIFHWGQAAAVVAPNSGGASASKSKDKDKHVPVAYRVKDFCAQLGEQLGGVPPRFVWFAEVAGDQEVLEGEEQDGGNGNKHHKKKKKLLRFIDVEFYKQKVKLHRRSDAADSEKSPGQGDSLRMDPNFVEEERQRKTRIGLDDDETKVGLPWSLIYTQPPVAPVHELYPKAYFGVLETWTEVFTRLRRDHFCSHAFVIDPENDGSNQRQEVYSSFLTHEAGLDKTKAFSSKTEKEVQDEEWYMLTQIVNRVEQRGNASVRDGQGATLCEWFFAHRSLDTLKELCQKRRGPEWDRFLTDSLPLTAFAHALSWSDRCHLLDALVTRRMESAASVPFDINEVSALDYGWSNYYNCTLFDEGQAQEPGLASNPSPPSFDHVVAEQHLMRAKPRSSSMVVADPLTSGVGLVDKNRIAGPLFMHLLRVEPRAVWSFLLGGEMREEHAFVYRKRKLHHVVAEQENWQKFMKALMFDVRAGMSNAKAGRAGRANNEKGQQAILPRISSSLTTVDVQKGEALTGFLPMCFAAKRNDLQALQWIAEMLEIEVMVADADDKSVKKTGGPMKVALLTGQKYLGFRLPNRIAGPPLHVEDLPEKAKSQLLSDVVKEIALSPLVLEPGSGEARRSGSKMSAGSGGAATRRSGSKGIGGTTNKLKNTHRTVKIKKAEGELMNMKIQSPAMNLKTAMNRTSMVIEQGSSTPQIVPVVLNLEKALGFAPVVQGTTYYSLIEDSTVQATDSWNYIDGSAGGYNFYDQNSGASSKQSVHPYAQAGESLSYGSAGALGLAPATSATYYMMHTASSIDGSLMGESRASSKQPGGNQLSFVDRDGQVEVAPQVEIEISESKPIHFIGLRKTSEDNLDKKARAGVPIQPEGEAVQFADSSEDEAPKKKLIMHTKFIGKNAKFSDEDDEDDDDDHAVAANKSQTVRPSKKSAVGGKNLQVRTAQLQAPRGEKDEATEGDGPACPASPASTTAGALIQEPVRISLELALGDNLPTPAQARASAVEAAVHFNSFKETRNSGCTDETAQKTSASSPKKDKPNKQGNLKNKRAEVVVKLHGVLEDGEDGSGNVNNALADEDDTLTKSTPELILEYLPKFELRMPPDTHPVSKTKPRRKNPHDDYSPLMLALQHGGGASFDFLLQLAAQEKSVQGQPVRRDVLSHKAADGHTVFSLALNDVSREICPEHGIPDLEEYNPIASTAATVYTIKLGAEIEGVENLVQEYLEAKKRELKRLSEKKTLMGKFLPNAYEDPKDYQKRQKELAQIKMDEKIMNQVQFADKDEEARVLGPLITSSIFTSCSTTSTSNYAPSAPPRTDAFSLVNQVFKSKKNQFFVEDLFQVTSPVGHSAINVEAWQTGRIPCLVELNTFHEKLLKESISEDDKANLVANLMQECFDIQLHVRDTIRPRALSRLLQVAYGASFIPDDEFRTYGTLAGEQETTVGKMDSGLESMLGSGLSTQSSSTSNTQAKTAFSRKNPLSLSSAAAKVKEEKRSIAAYESSLAGNYRSLQDAVGISIVSLLTQASSGGVSAKCLRILLDESPELRVDPTRNPLDRLPLVRKMNENGEGRQSAFKFPQGQGRGQSQLSHEEELEFYMKRTEKQTKAEAEAVQRRLDKLTIIKTAHEHAAAVLQDLKTQQIPRILAQLGVEVGDGDATASTTALTSNATAISSSTATTVSTNKRTKCHPAILAVIRKRLEADVDTQSLVLQSLGMYEEANKLPPPEPLPAAPPQEQVDGFCFTCCSGRKQ
ncbi:unnamed protein product [Amoebophrya sp. A25]|nr:unnamed protein product [Amoebophrya sp. A25]|eukprot:GSA25T00004787001.1